MMLNQTCYCAALRKATRRVTATYDAALAQHGITLAQFSLLRTLGRHGPLSLTELGNRMELDRSTIGRNIRVIEKSGLVQPAPRPDSREAAIELSARGRALLATAEPLWAATQDSLEAKLGASGILTLLDSLGKL
jgi:DNA-binding MarR family transcriptional regulator